MGSGNLQQNHQLLIRMLKFAMNLTDDGIVGQQVFAGEATQFSIHDRRSQRRQKRISRKKKTKFRRK